MLHIHNLTVAKGDTLLLRGLELTLAPGQVHAIMGPNGAGKSTLCKVLAGDPSYDIVEGDIILQNQSLRELEPEERAHRGLFLGFQYPVEVPGITNLQFLLAAYNAKRTFQKQALCSSEEFTILLQEPMARLQIKKEFLTRNINEGFSGGEKKRNEILQMLILDPVCMILDETDSGLDIDAMKVVAQGVNRCMSADKVLLLITHYERLLEYIKPDVVHILMDGKIVHSGTSQLARELEEKGYDTWGGR